MSTATSHLAPAPARPSRNPRETMSRYIARLEEWSRTPDGIAFDEQVRAQVEQRREGERAQWRREQFDRTGIPQRYQTLFAAGAPKATEAMTAIAQLSGDILVLAGRPGCGKTVAACWWLAEFINAPVPPRQAPRFTTAGQLARGSRFDEGRMGGLIGAPRLVIDDLGMEYADDKGFFASIVDELIDARYSAMRPTVITTNLLVEQFRARYGERVADRMREAGVYVELDTRSMRAP